MKRQFIIAVLVSVLFSGCSKDDSSEDGSGSVSAATLVYPGNNSECTTGISVSETDSKITFEWNAAPNASSYYLYVKNLVTQAQLQYNPGNTTSLEVSLKKGTPYSWYVVSRSADATAESPKWKFYNAGEGTVNYAPFPAEVVSPAMSSSVYGTSVALEWTASDIDNDIAVYKVYFDTNPNPTTLKTTTNNNQLPDVAVMANTTYYWKVETADSEGNVSHSPVFQFRVL